MFERPGSGGGGSARAKFFCIKGKIMSIIIKSKGQKSDADKTKQLYTWVGCGMVVVLTLISVIPNMGGEKAPDYSKFSSTRMQDLAALPFGTDASASDFLRNNPEYAGISNADLLGALFSSEERKERQEKDKAEGVPPPPDPEYKEIADRQNKIEQIKEIQKGRLEKKVKNIEAFNKAKEELKSKQLARAQKEQARKEAKQNAMNAVQQSSKQGSKQNSKQDSRQAVVQNGKQNAKQTRQAQGQKSSPQTLGGNGKMAGAGSTGSTGVTGSIWRYEGKDIPTSNTSMSLNHAANSQDLAYAKKMGGRGAGIYEAGVESLKGAGADSAEGAAAGAIDAFQKDVAAEDLEKDEQELGLDELPQGLDEDLMDDLKRDLGDAVNDQPEGDDGDDGDGDNSNDYSINENCMDTKGEINGKCMMMKIIGEALKFGISYLTWGAQGGWQEQSRIRSLEKKYGVTYVNGNFFDRDGNIMKLPKSNKKD